MRKGQELGQLAEIGIGILGFVIWGKLQRRGTHVNTLKIGSRGELLCFWRNLGFYAVLRREYNWRIWFWSILRGLGDDPRGGNEEGGPLVFFRGVL
jgi:hypothetical protein